MGRNLPLEWELEPDMAAYNAAKSLLKTKPLEAIPLFRALAEHGSFLSMLELGRASTIGLGTAVDLAEAESWFRKVAEIRSVRGHWYLGRFLLGRQRYDEAEEALSFAAARGYGPALLDLGKISYLGLGRPKDLQTATRFFERAAERGNLRAKALAGLIRYKASQTIAERLRNAIGLAKTVFEAMTVMRNQGFESERLIR